MSHGNRSSRGIPGLEPSQREGRSRPGGEIYPPPRKSVPALTGPPGMRLLDTGSGAIRGENQRKPRQQRQRRTPGGPPICPIGDGIEPQQIDAEDAECDLLVAAVPAAQSLVGVTAVRMG